MNLGPHLDRILDVKYTGGVDEKERRKKKRREVFASQVTKAVEMMKVLHLEK